MKPFNLAQDKIAERAYCRQQFVRRLKTIGFLVVFAVVAAAVSWGCRISTAGKAARLRAELAGVQGRCALLKNEIAAVKARAAQRKWQKQLAGESRRWLDILDDLLSRVPDDVWLNRLESSESKSSIAIQGRAASFASISRFIASIRASPAFSDARLVSTQTSSPRASEADGTYSLGVEFALQAKLKTTGSPAVAQAAPASTAVPPVEGSP
ncbi:MAG: PilN domain-containing protein [Armatimonadota bacterium]